MGINAVPERFDVLDEEDRLGNQRFTAPWLEFLRSVFYGLFGWKRSFTATSNLDFPNIVAGGNAVGNIAVRGARAGDAVIVTASRYVSGLGVYGYVAGDDVVQVVRFNYSTGAIDPAPDDFRVVVLQQ